MSKVFIKKSKFILGYQREKEILMQMNNESESVIKYFGFDDLNKLIQIEKGDDDLNQLYFKYLSVNKTIPKNVLKIIIKHLLKGIEFITLKGIIHGDIKMENVVIVYNDKNL